MFVAQATWFDLNLDKKGSRSDSRAKKSRWFMVYCILRQERKSLREGCRYLHSKSLSLPPSCLLSNQPLERIIAFRGGYYRAKLCLLFPHSFAVIAFLDQVEQVVEWAKVATMTLSIVYPSRSLFFLLLLQLPLSLSLSLSFRLASQFQP